MSEDTPLCERCNCAGNLSCVYPPPEDMECDCALDAAGLCPCCNMKINRMNYRPEEDGQEALF